MSWRRRSPRRVRGTVAQAKVGRRRGALEEEDSLTLQRRLYEGGFSSLLEPLQPRGDRGTTTAAQCVTGPRLDRWQLDPRRLASFGRVSYAGPGATVGVMDTRVPSTGSHGPLGPRRRSPRSRILPLEGSFGRRPTPRGELTKSPLERGPTPTTASLWRGPSSPRRHAMCR